MISALDPEAIAGLTRSQVSQFSQEQLSALSSQQISKLSGEALNSISLANFSALSGSISGITASQVRLLSHRLAPAFETALSTQIGPDAFENISVKFLHELSYDQVSVLSTAQLAVLPTSTLANLTAGFFDKLNQEQYLAIKANNSALSQSARGLLITKYGA
jgi:hypothetical protein